MKLEFMGKNKWREIVNPFFTINYERKYQTDGTTHFISNVVIASKNNDSVLRVDSYMASPNIMGAKRNANLEISNLLMPEDK